jgi:hypothetical protein
MLRAVGSRAAAMLGDRLAILAIQARDHPGHQLTGTTRGCVAGETRRDPVDYRRELSPPWVRVYAMNRGDRGIFRCLHKLRTIPRPPFLAAQTGQHNNPELWLQY